MPSDVPEAHAQAHNLPWLLASLLTNVPKTTAALLTSSDGIPRAFQGMDQPSADRLSAIASGMCSLARSVAVSSGRNEGVRQVVVELDQTLLFIAAAGPGGVLAVMAVPDVDAGVLGFQMAHLVKSVRPFLATPPRDGLGIRATTR